MKNRFNKGVILCLITFLFLFSVVLGVMAADPPLGEYYVSEVSFSIASGVSKIIFEHDVARTIWNNGTMDLFIPVKTAAEWLSVANNITGDAIVTSTSGGIPGFFIVDALSPTTDTVILNATILEADGCAACPFGDGPCSFDATQRCCDKYNGGAIFVTRCGRYITGSVGVTALDGGICPSLVNACWQTHWVFLEDVGYVLSDAPKSCSDIFACPVAGSYTTD